jgi:hypothetical protein
MAFHEICNHIIIVLSQNKNLTAWNIVATRDAKNLGKVGLPTTSRPTKQNLLGLTQKGHLLYIV